MKFYLLKDDYVIFRYENKEFYEGSSWEGVVRYDVQRAVGNVIPFSKTEAELTKCEKVKDLLHRLCHSGGMSNGEDNDRMWKMEVRAGVSKIPCDSGSLKGYLQLKDEFPRSCINALQELSNNEATVQIEFKQIVDLPEDSFSVAEYKLTTSETEIGTENGIICNDTEVEFPTNYFENQGYGTLTVIIHLPDCVLDDNYLLKSSPLPNVSLNQKILEQEIFADVKIVASNGTCIKAHKNFLGSQSPIFYKIFNGDLAENRESIIEMAGVSEESVRAFLRYLYYEDLSLADGEMEQIFELYYAAHKFRVESLEKLMTDTILEKPDAWFKLDTTIKMFVFTENVSGENFPVNVELQTKMVEMLKTFFDQLTESRVYQDLLKTNPAAATQLYKLALS